MNPTKARYALLVAADALDRDAWLLGDLIADDEDAAEMTAPQVIDCLRILATLIDGRELAPEPSPEEQAEIDRFGIFAEESKA